MKYKNKLNENTNSGASEEVENDSQTGGETMNNTGTKRGNNQFIRVAIIVVCVLGAMLCILLFVFFVPHKNETYCNPIGNGKRYNDSLFIPVRCKGLIYAIEDKVYMDHNNYAELMIDADLDFGYQGQTTETRQVKFPIHPKHGEIRVGLSFDFSRMVSVGDTFVKVENEFEFKVVKKNRLVLKSELEFPGHCPSGDCTFKRHGGELCFTRE